MAKINLRPWREERNLLLQKQFVTNLVVALVLGAAAVFAIMYYYDMQMDRQKKRGEYLRQEIVQLDRQISEIQDLERKRSQLMERLEAIESLQGARPVIVRSFDELVRVLPDESFYSFIERKGDVLQIQGFAQQNFHVSALMRSLERSVWFGEPSLSRVSADAQGRAYNLTVPMERPKVEEVSR